MVDKIADSRSKKVVFIANCILNANNKVYGFARYPGMFEGVIEQIQKYNLGIIQMPCPEALHVGNQRWWTAKNMYDNVGYRRFSREIAAQMVDYMVNYQKVGFEVTAILTCDGSPTCGINKSSYYENAGGKPEMPIRSLKNEPGVFMEELVAEMNERLDVIPPIYGLEMDNLELSNEEILKDFIEYMDNKEMGGE